MASLFRVTAATQQKPKKSSGGGRVRAEKLGIDEFKNDCDIDDPSDPSDPRPKFTFGKSLSNEIPKITEPKEPPKPTPKEQPKETSKEAQQDLPDLPGCTEKIFGCPGWLSGLSLFREFGNHSAQIYLYKRLEKSAVSQGFQLQKMTHEWNPESKKWWPLQEQSEAVWAVPIQKLDQFATWALARSRKTKDEKVRMLAKLGITIPDEAVLKGPVENELLGVLSQCLPFKIEYQYRVGKYRLDAFIPRLHLAIQIDEYGHRGYDASEEKEYDEVIRDHNIVCIRFNPHQKYSVPPQFELIRLVWERTLSPDFSAFREKLKLV